MRTALFLILMLAATIAAGEFVLVATYLVLPIVIWQKSRSGRFPRTLGSACAALLILHLLGFKFYGKPAVADLESLKNPKRVYALECPNLVCFEDGSKLPMPHVFFPSDIAVVDPEPSIYHQGFRGIGNLRVLLDSNGEVRKGITIETAAPTNESTGLYCLQKATYWCGNTWTPWFFPERLPRCLKVDLGPGLVSAGLAFPTANYLTNRFKRDQILGAMERAFVPDLPIAHPEIIALGLALIDLGTWDQGLDLLVETRATNELAKLCQRILRELEITIQQPESDVLVALWTERLCKVDPATAKLELRKRVEQKRLDAPNAGHLAWRLSRDGDLSGFDLLFEQLRNTDHDSRSVQTFTFGLACWFRYNFELDGAGFPVDFGPEFVSWYAAVRPRLKVNHRGFIVDNGVPFDGEYYASMRPFKEQSAIRHGRRLSKERFYD